jgi:hypothetical protein
MSKIDTSKITTSKIDFGKVKGPVSAVPGPGQAVPAQTATNEEDRSKDAFFVQVAEMAEAMIARHGKEFAIGTLVLAAKFIAEDRPLIKRDIGHGEAAGAAKACGN